MINELNKNTSKEYKRRLKRIEEIKVEIEEMQEKVTEEKEEYYKLFERLVPFILKLTRLEEQLTDDFFESKTLLELEQKENICVKNKLI